MSLPAGYVREHVRLGYAATEHGNQGDTTTIGIELATPATTRRGLYVGTTRGRERNLILVVTDSEDIDDARDLLDRVLASDRVDIPATTQRRTLAATNQPPARPVRRHEPRHPIPEWFDDLEAEVRQELDRARTAADAGRRSVTDLEDRLAGAERDLADAIAELTPHQPALAATRQHVEDTHRQQRVAEHAATNAPRRQRRAAQEHAAAATVTYQQAVAARRRLETTLAPVSARYRDAAARVEDLRASLAPARYLHDWSGHPEQVEQLTRLADAVEAWRDWATGEPVSSNAVQAMVAALDRCATGDRQVGLNVLTTSVRSWAAEVGIQFRDAHEIDAPRLPAGPGISL